MQDKTQMERENGKLHTKQDDRMKKRPVEEQHGANATTNTANRSLGQLEMKKSNSGGVKSQDQTV